MAKENNLPEMSPKQLRTLRNNLNNRLATFKEKGEGAQSLQKSHRLAGMTEGQCQELLVVVQREIRRRAFAQAH